MSKVSPNCEKIALNKFNSLTVLSLAIAQASQVIKLANSQPFNTNTSKYNMKLDLVWNLYNKFYLFIMLFVMNNFYLFIIYSIKVIVNKLNILYNLSE